MRLLLQRVQSASVKVAEADVAAIGAGLLVFVGIVPEDSATEIDWLVRKTLGLRIFASESNPSKEWDRNIVDASGELLVVSQFTLQANLNKGMRPSFSTAAPPEIAQPIYERFVQALSSAYPHVRSGVFGADMQVSLVNDGPATFVLDRGATLS